MIFLCHFRAKSGVVMTENIKKPTHRSPNYPLKPLDWAVETAMVLLGKEGKHAVHPDIVAQNLGYKDASNGMVRRVLANLKAFGVLEKAAGGKLAVSSDVSRYKIMPTEEGKRVILEQWLRRPGLFANILDKYNLDLPSDKALLFELVEDYGFSEQAAESAIAVLRSSISFVQSTGRGDEEGEGEGIDESPDRDISDDADMAHMSDADKPKPRSESARTVVEAVQVSVADAGVKYPVRLSGGRMAWIHVPESFYQADKKKLRAQIEVIGTEDEDYDFEGDDS